MRKTLIAALVALCATPAMAVTPGWHSSDVALCGWFLSPPNTRLFFVELISGDFLFTTGDFELTASLQVPCDSGNFLAWHVTDPSGNFDETVSLPHK